MLEAGEEHLLSNLHGLLRPPLRRREAFPPWSSRYAVAGGWRRTFNKWPRRGLLDLLWEVEKPPLLGPLVTLLLEAGEEHLLSNLHGLLRPPLRRREGSPPLFSMVALLLEAGEEHLLSSLHGLLRPPLRRREASPPWSSHHAVAGGWRKTSSQQPQ